MSCFNCAGRGYTITCIDDMCHGLDECIHGDGETPCPYCKGRDEEFEEDEPELSTAEEIGAGSYLGWGNSLP